MTSGGLVAIAPDPAGDLVDRLREAGRDLDESAGAARVVLLGVDRPSGAPALIEDVARWALRAAGDLRGRIDEVVRLDAPVRVGDPEAAAMHLDVRRVDDVDELLADLEAVGVLRRCFLPDDPALRHAAVAALPPALLARLVEQAPEVLGHADGVPAAVRDLANRVLLDREIRRLDDLDAVALGPRGRGLLDDLRTWRDDPDLQLLKLDAASGRIVLARGRLDRASHVATIVPGAGLRLAGLSRRHVGWMDHLQQAMEQRLRADGRGAGAATVLWLDYDAPQRLVPGAVRRDAATDAATRLPEFLAGVGAVDRELVTTIGHSYGSVVLGRSLADHAQRLPTDRLVALGSPGLGVQLSHQLGLRDDQRLYAATFDEDPIALAGQWHPLTGDLGRAVHGPDPRRLRVAETVRLSTHDLDDGGPFERHLQYLEPGSSALRTVADLAAGSAT